MRAYLAALRLKTLPAAIVPVALAAALVHRSGLMIRWDLLGLTLAGAVLIQIATNFFNDALDSDTGADGPDRLGPVRATASGQLSRSQVMAAGYLCLLFAVACSVPLIMARGWVIVAIGIPSIYLAYGYTGGGLRLAYRGLGEIFVMLFFGWIAVLGSVFVLGGELDWRAWALGTGCGGFSSVLIAVNNLRDIEGDRRVNKMTLAARFGPTFGRLVITLSLLLGYGGILSIEFADGVDLWLLAYVLPGVLGLTILAMVWGWEPSKRLNKALAFGGLQLILIAVIFAWRSL